MKKEIEAFLAEGNNNSDSADGIFDFLSRLSDSVQEEFDEHLSSDSDKKRFDRVMSGMFALLLNKKVGTPQKIKQVIKIAIETTLKI